MRTPKSRLIIAIVPVLLPIGCLEPNPLSTSEGAGDGTTEVDTSEVDTGSETETETEAGTSSDSADDSEADSSETTETETESSDTDSSDTEEKEESETTAGYPCPFEDVGVRRQIVEVDCSEGNLTCKGRVDCSDTWVGIWPLDEVANWPNVPSLWGSFECMPNIDADHCVDPDWVSFSSCFWAIDAQWAVPVTPLCNVDEPDETHIALGNGMATWKLPPPE